MTPRTWEDEEEIVCGTDVNVTLLARWGGDAPAAVVLNSWAPARAPKMTTAAIVTVGTFLNDRVDLPADRGLFEWWTLSNSSPPFWCPWIPPDPGIHRNRHYRSLT
jgi:hypothetical protein